MQFSAKFAITLELLFSNMSSSHHIFPKKSKGHGLLHISMNKALKWLIWVSGSEVVIVKNGRRICGTGAAFSNAPINQDKAYFEIKIQSSGTCKPVSGYQVINGFNVK